jgi:predicted RND superfamily exporter protein
MMLRKRTLAFLARLASFADGKVAYAAAAILTLISLLVLPRMEIHTTRQGMVREDLPVQSDFLAYMEEFGSPTQLVAVLEGETDDIKNAADAVAEKLSRETRWVRNVFYRVDVDTFRQSSLYYLPTGNLEAFRDFLAAEPARNRTLLVDHDLPALLDLADRSASGASENVLNHPILDLAVAALEHWARLLEKDEDQLELGLDQAIEELARGLLGAETWVDPDGFLLSTDHRLAFLFIQQTESSDSASFIVPFMEYVRREVSATLADYPGVTVGFTGWPAAIEEDYTLLMNDLPRVSLLATIVVLAIFLAAFRSLYRTLLVFVPLGCGVIWTLGLTVFVLGHLNYLSSVFVGILFGLGIDFGIYFIRRFDEERLGGLAPAEAVHRTLTTAGQGIMTGGLTAVVSFLALGATDQPAFAELGIVAGMGVGSVLVATLFLLPPLLIRFPPSLKGVQTEVSSPRLEGSARFVLRRPGVVSGVFATVVIGLAFYLPWIDFDFNLNNLLPADSETLRVLRNMEKRSPYTDQFVAVVADDLEQARHVHAAVEAMPTVRRVESLASVIPPEIEAKKRLLQEIALLLPDFGEGALATVNPALLSRRLDPLIARLEQAQEDAFSSGRVEAVKVADALLEPLLSVREALRAPEAARRQAAFEQALFAGRDRLVQQFEKYLEAEPLTIENLDPVIGGRFVGRTGKMAVLAFPTEPIWHPDFLDRFVTEVRGAAESFLGSSEKSHHRVTGFAVVYHVTGPAIRRGFNGATLGAGILVAIMLLIDLKRPRAALMALTPLVVTVVVLLGGMAWFGIHLTMATQVAFPILFGLGVAYGVHMVHRMSEDTEVGAGHAVGTTGKAVGLAAATTMAGFGAMTIAKHSALVGFGTVLVTGIFISAVTALFLVPSLATLFSLQKKSDSRRS